MKIILSMIPLITLLSCTGDESVTVPIFENGGLLANTSSLSATTSKLIEGIYSVESGSDNFGRNVVIKFTGNTFSIFTGKNFAYFVLNVGIKDSSIVFEGYWRFAQDSKTGLAILRLDANEGGKQIIKNNTPNSSFVLRGSFGDGNNSTQNELILRYIRPINKSKIDFKILAHRGGGRNLDQLPESENSLGMMQIAESFGANGIEIDVRLTNDNVPIIYHDENLSPRLVVGEFAIGPIKNYSYAHLLTLCRLKNGELIPTLKEALETIINKTNLSVVWLDVKDPAAIPQIIKLQEEYVNLAIAAGRKLEILIGLPDDTAVEEFQKQPNFQNAASLCELEFDTVINSNSLVWAPAWTRGPMIDEVSRMRGLGKRVFFWTLDGPEFIKVFLDEGAADGILSNYPSIVAYEYYIR
ncbi:MAG: glycerophosphodiester phosphodiesterase family protein [Melioribacteraceae bacterium]